MFQEMIDDGMGWEAQMDDEAQRFEEESADFDWQAELDNDPDYHAWLDAQYDMELERQADGFTVEAWEL